MFRRKKDETDEPKFTPATDDLPPVEAMPKPFPRPAGGPVPSPFGGTAAKPPVVPVAGARPAVQARTPVAENGETKKLIVGREIVLSGQITSCDRLVVEGKVEASLTDSHAIEIADIGFFKGTAEIELGGDRRALRRHDHGARPPVHPLDRSGAGQDPLRSDRDRARRRDLRRCADGRRHQCPPDQQPVDKLADHAVFYVCERPGRLVLTP